MVKNINLQAAAHVVGILDPWAERAETHARRVASARDPATLAQLAPEARGIAEEMLEAGAGGGMVARVLSALNDSLAVRAIALAARRHRLPAVDWCWLAFGSEGRGEQTLITDQDNGIVFAAVGAAEARALRPLLTACAREVNQTLADCGFPLCEGRIMAGNPECCLSLDEWKERFAAWVRLPEPDALLNSTIFFDLRGLFGKTALVTELRQALAGQLDRADAFLHLMACNALAASPPLGVLRDFAAKEGQLDIKKSGSRIFVDAARILGMRCRSPSTVARLRHAAEQGMMAAADAEGAIDAFHCLQQLRLRVQGRALAAGQPAANLVAPKTLNEFEYNLLLEALKQARMLQQRLKITYRIEG